MSKGVPPTGVRAARPGPPERTSAAEPSEPSVRARAAVGRGVDITISLVIAVAGFIVLSRLMGWTIHPLVVLGQAALPVSMLPVWPAMVWAAVRRLPIRFVMALLLAVSHVLAVIPALGSQPRPEWARAGAVEVGSGSAAPVLLRVVAANVYFGNREPGIADALLAAAGDVYVLAEINPAQQLQLERDGLFRRFPYRLETAPSEFGQTLIMSRTPLSDAVAVDAPGVWTPVATVTKQGRTIKIIAAHPRSPVDACCIDELVDWLRWARDEGRSTTELLVIAGDFNATRFFPAMGELFAAGFSDAHEAKGRGLSASWPAGGEFFDLPFMRLDHVMYRGDVVATAVHDLRVPGSDHLGVVADLVVR